MLYKLLNLPTITSTPPIITPSTPSKGSNSDTTPTINSKSSKKQRRNSSGIKKVSSTKPNRINQSRSITQEDNTKDLASSSTIEKDQSIEELSPPPILRVRNYHSIMSSRHSDHRPVCAQFELQL